MFLSGSLWNDHVHDEFGLLALLIGALLDLVLALVLLISIVSCLLSSFLQPQLALFGSQVLLVTPGGGSWPVTRATEAIRRVQVKRCMHYE